MTTDTQVEYKERKEENDYKDNKGSWKLFWFQKLMTTAVYMMRL